MGFEFEKGDIVTSKKGVLMQSFLTDTNYLVFKFEVVDWNNCAIVALKKRRISDAKAKKLAGLVPIPPAPKGAGILGD